MTGILRQQQKIFADNAPIRLVTAFRTASSNAPVQSKTPDVIQNENFLNGWINPDNTGNVLPNAEDMNGVLYTLSYNTAYIFEKGIAEYSESQTYQTNSFCQYGGYLYRCKADETINIVPTNTNYWDKIETDAYSADNIGTGVGIYAGASGTQFQFKTLVAADSSIELDYGADYVSIKAIASTPAITASSPLIYNAGALSMQAADSSHDGYITAADWASFNGKLSSTIFSSANTWTAKNTFSADIDASAIYTTRLKTKYDSSYGSHINHYYTDSNNTETLWLVDGYENGMTNLGLIPAVNNAVLGTSSYKWDSAFINDIYTDWFRPTAVAMPSSQVGIGEAYLAADSSTHFPILSVKFYMSGSSLIEAVLPTEVTNNNTNIRELGDLTHYWNSAYFSHTRTNSLLPISTGGSIGSSSKYYSDGYITNFYSTNIVTDKVASSINPSIYLELQDVGASKDWILFNQNSYIKAYQGGNLECYFEDLADPTLHGGFTCSYNQLKPLDNNTYVLGDTTALFRRLHINRVYANNVYSNAGDAHIAFSSDGKEILISPYDSATRDIYFTATSVYPNNNNYVDLGKSNNRWKTIYTVNNVNVSDRRLKGNVENLEDALCRLNTIGVKSFTMDNHEEGIMYGFIAQDELERNPELVVVPEDYDETEEDAQLGYMPNNVLFLAVKAIQELSAKVDSLEQQLRSYRNED